jgi:hypothetical protein
VAAHRHDAAARAADVPEQELEDRPRADDLHARGVLRPAHGVGEHRRPLAPRVGHERVGHLAEGLGRDAADLLHHLGRVAREVALRIWKTQRGSCSVSSRRMLPSFIPAPVLSSNAWAVCSRTPAADAISPPSYIQVERSYRPVSGSNPEKTPARSSVSWNLSLMIVDAFV